MGILSMVKTGFTAVKAFTVGTAIPVAVAHSPLILAGFAVAGVITTAVVAWKCGIASENAVRKKQAEIFESGSTELLTNKDRLKIKAKYIAAVVVSVILTSASVLGSWWINNTRLTEMTTTANTLLANNRALTDELRNVHDISPDTQRAAMVERIKNDLAAGAKYHDTGTGKERFFDHFSGQYFLASIEWVTASIKRFQNEWRYLKRGGELKMEKFYNYLQVPAQFTGMANILCFSKTLDVDDLQVPNFDLDYQTLYKDGDLEEEGIWILDFYPPNFLNFRFTTDYGLDEEATYPSYIDAEDNEEYLSDAEKKYATYAAI